MKALQKFSKESIRKTKKFSPEEIVKFLDDFRRLHGANAAPPSKLISLRVPVALLEAFQTKSRRRGMKYQTQIKTLMAGWVSASGR